jgi:hypothetical protein
MSHLLAIGALDARIVTGEGALAALMTLCITVTAHNLAGIGAVLLAMAFFTTVVTSSTTTAALRAVSRKVTNYSRYFSDEAGWNLSETYLHRISCIRRPQQNEVLGLDSNISMLGCRASRRHYLHSLEE